MQPTQDMNSTPSGELLAVSLELSNRSWKIALHDGRRDKPTVHTVAGEQADKRLSEAIAVIESTKEKWGLSEQTRVSAAFLVRSPDGFYRFSHKSFREYFLARYLLRSAKDGVDALRNALSVPANSAPVMQFTVELLDVGEKIEPLREKMTSGLRELLTGCESGQASENAEVRAARHHLAIGAQTIHARFRHRDHFHPDARPPPSPQPYPSHHLLA